MSKGYLRGRGRCEALRDPNPLRKFRTKFDKQAVTATTLTTSNGFIAVPVFLPEGFVMILGGSAFVNYSTASANVTNATFGSNLALGTVADNTGGGLTSTFANIAASAAAPAAVAKAVSGANVHSLQIATGTALVIDNHSADQSAFLNIEVAAADMSDGTTASFILSGFADIFAFVMGDK